MGGSGSYKYVRVRIRTLYIDPFHGMSLHPFCDLNAHCPDKKMAARFAGVKNKQYLCTAFQAMGGYQSGQMGQTVNLLAMPSVVRIHHHPLITYEK